MKHASHNDKRRYLRYELLDYAMTYTATDDQGMRSVIADVGLGGLALRSRISLPIGEELSIVIGRGSADGLQIKGIVRHCDLMQETGLYASGIQFIPKTHDERLAVAQYVNDVFQRHCDSITA